jgi:hypothetical protein
MTNASFAWIISTGIALATHGYVRIAQDHGVTVYKRESGHIDLAAEGDIPAPPEKVRAALLDYASHPRWVHNLKETRVLGRGEAELYVYQRLGLPIIDDRDFTLHVQWGSDADGVLWTHFETANDRGPPPSHGVVRVAMHRGGWRLEPIDGGRATHARYFVDLDLGGSLPGWMSRGRAGKEIPGFFESLRKRVIQY